MNPTCRKCPHINQKPIYKAVPKLVGTLFNINDLMKKPNAPIWDFDTEINHQPFTWCEELHHKIEDLKRWKDFDTCPYHLEHLLESQDES